MNIAYLLEDTDQSGGVRVQLAHADALIARGHRVRLVTKGLPLTWRSSRAEWIYVDDFRQYDAGSDDFVIGTFWITVPFAHELAQRYGTRAVHLCQGYEGAFSAYENIRGQIEATYRLPIPKLVVSRSLIDVCKRFHDDVTYIGQVVEEEFYRAVTPREHEPLRVLVSGQAQADLKGIQDAYGAVAHARWFHQKLELIRVSPWAPSREEPLDAVQEFHVALTTGEMTRLMHSCDALIAPNHREEGFGLPAAEAMASGIPTLVTSIPSYLSFDPTHDYALFAPEANAVEMGERLIELLSDEALRDRLRTRGREVAQQWRVGHVAERLEAFFRARL
ncbi:MAG TPA: glycosyltransferase family 4 protein [Thermoanaerobaculia bacterium]|nr:glycosyltransferase family 4 protein [Thermoanaerobaculia bacterium]